MFVWLCVFESSGFAWGSGWSLCACACVPAWTHVSPRVPVCASPSSPPSQCSPGSGLSLRSLLSGSRAVQETITVQVSSHPKRLQEKCFS